MVLTVDEVCEKLTNMTPCGWKDDSRDVRKCDISLKNLNSTKLYGFITNFGLLRLWITLSEAVQFEKEGKGGLTLGSEMSPKMRSKNNY